MKSFGKHLNVCVVGASGGIGRALTQELARSKTVDRIFALARRNHGSIGSKPSWLPIDIADEASIAHAAEAVRQAAGELHLVLVATGILHDDSLRPEKAWRELSAESFQRAYRVNAIGPALVGKHFLPLLARDRKSAFAVLSARVGSIADNRLGGWYAYRSSKAALNMILRTLAVELARRNPSALCVGLHPGTVDTQLSFPFQARVPPGKLFSPSEAATNLLRVVDGLTGEATGRVFAWDGTEVEP